jgi:hypothetical protein
MRVQTLCLHNVEFAGYEAIVYNCYNKNERSVRYRVTSQTHLSDDDSKYVSIFTLFGILISRESIRPILADAAGDWGNADVQSRPFLLDVVRYWYRHQL